MSRLYVYRKQIECVLCDASVLLTHVFMHLVCYTICIWEYWASCVIARLYPSIKRATRISRIY